MKLIQYARPLAFVVLAAVTVYGVYLFATGDWSTAMAFWRDRVVIIPLVLLLATLDVALEMVGWMWVYNRLGIPAFNLGGVCAYMSGRAGLLLPAQLGRLIRPDAMARLDRERLGKCMRAEVGTFVLDSTSVAALLAAMIGFMIHPWLAIPAALGSIGVLLFLGNQVASRVSHTRIALPRNFWWSWQTFLIVVVEMFGWAAHGVAFYLVICDLPGNITLWDALFYAPASAVLGVATGLPGGIGATEGLLGASLKIMEIPSEHLALTVGAFRLLTFWIWIPIGWLALTAVNRRVASRRRAAEAAEAAEA